MTETSTDLAVREPAVAPATVGLFNTDNPDVVLARSVKVANVLKDVVSKKGLVLKIGQSEYIRVEGWTTLGALVGVFAQTEWTHPLPDEAGWEAAVVVRNAQGAEFGRAEAQCLRAEKNWKNRDDFALRSMAQTRAMGKALRMPLGFIAVLAGYEATPAEEMPNVEPADIPFEAGPARTTDIPPVEGGAATASRAQTPANGGEASAKTETGAASLPPLSEAAEELTARLRAAAEKLGVLTATETMMVRNRLEHAGEIGKHTIWLRRQVKVAEENVEALADDESQFKIPDAVKGGTT